MRSSLIYLEKALQIEQRHQSTAAKADTHLNMCAVLSQLSRHEHAMLHAHQAIIIVQSTLLMHHLPARKENLVKSKVGADEQAKLREGINDTKEFKDRIAVLTIAYHNLAVEQEFMHMYHEAVSSYK